MDEGKTLKEGEDALEARVGNQELPYWNVEITRAVTVELTPGEVRGSMTMRSS